MGTLKEKLRNGEPIFGVLSFIASPVAIEVMGYAGLDFVIVDMQHTSLSWEVAEHLVRAGQVAGISVVIRIPAIQDDIILRALETGAEGIVLPFVRSAQDVRQVMAASLYPPLGGRSVCSQARAAAFGAKPDYRAHTENLNQRTIVFGLIEDMEGVEALPEILALEPGLDVIGLGRGDLAASLGLIGKVNAPPVAAAVEQIMSSVEQADRRTPVAVFAYEKSEVASWKARGCQVFVAVSDTWLLAQSTKAFVAMREA